MAAIGYEAQIAEALLQRLEGLALSPALPVAYPDVSFTKPLDVNSRPLPYLEANLIDAPTQSLAVTGGTNAFSGILQVTVVYPQNSGIYKSRSIAASVVAWFKRETKMYSGSTCVEIVQIGTVSQAIEDPPYTRTPISIRYVAYLPQPA